MPKTLDSRWNSKDSLLRSITDLVRRHQFEIDRLGTGDVFEIKRASSKCVLIALKETGAARSSKQEGRAHWIGVPGSFLDRMWHGIEEKTLGGLLFFLIDHWDQHLIVIPGGPALGTILDRQKKGPNLHFSFDVKKTASGYALVTARAEPEIVLSDIDSLESLTDLLFKIESARAGPGRS